MKEESDPRDFLHFVVEYMYDLIPLEPELGPADKRGLDEAYTTDEQIAYLRSVYETWRYRD